MKQIIILFSFLGVSVIAQSQNIDSILSITQTIELSLSTPQPRLNEKFKVSLDANHLRTNIFRSLLSKVKFANEIGSSEYQEMVLELYALQKGKSEIGPLEFTVNGTSYKTNKIIYEVIDALPNTDEGLWFRKVNISESLFCIIIDQRIPASSKTTKSDNSITFTTEAVTNEITKFKDSYSIKGLNNTNSFSNTIYDNVVDSKGIERKFLSAYSVYYFTIEDKNIKIEITKDKFQNFPPDYQFTNIAIQ